MDDSSSPSRFSFEGIADGAKVIQVIALKLSRRRPVNSRGVKTPRARMIDQETRVLSENIKAARVQRAMDIFITTFRWFNNNVALSSINNILVDRGGRATYVL
jgi:hypothetical protein